MKSVLAIVLVIVGVVAANQLGAQTTSISPAPTGTTGTLGTATLPVVQNVVEITRAVPAGATAIDAFTVPTGVTLVVTDIVVTNTGTTPVCGGAVNRSGGTAIAPVPTTNGTGTPTATGATATTTATPTIVAAPPLTTQVATGTTSLTGNTATTSIAGTLTQTDSTVTGPLCVPAQTTTVLPLTTGIEFTSGQIVQLLNGAAAPGTTGTPAPLAFHLRGVLMTAI
jgi:hypothetical protein